MSSVPAASRTIGADAPRFTHAHWWLATMLLTLHAGTAWGIEHGWARGLLLAHFGLFLLWQPLWRGEREIGPGHAALTILAVVGLAAAAGWWLLALWLAMMFGLLGGRATGTVDGRTRLTLLLGAAYVLALLLAWVVPHLFNAWRPEPLLVPMVRYVLPVFLVGIVVVPPSRPAQPRSTAAIDLFYAVVLFLLVVVLVLGSFVLQDAAHGRYGYALMQTLFGLAVLLAVLSWLWNPHGGYAGLQQLLSRYAAGIGLPFEHWVSELAGLAAHVPSAPEFMAQALDALLRTAHVKGVEWRCNDARIVRGTGASHAVEFAVRGQTYALRLAARPAAVMTIHLKLVVEVLAHFYEAKVREERERHNAYEQAIHETGARLTHDVKNVLQSLRALCAAAREAGPEDDSALLALLRRQLPALAERMGGTLEKLRAPARNATTLVSAETWWRELTERYGGRGVAFASYAVDGAAQLPCELFDSAAENLIENALRKSDPPPRVTVALRTAGGSVALDVADDGMAVPDATARDLLHRPVESQLGLGVGLYHCALQAERTGYRLTLAQNEPGAVRFMLAGRDVKADGPR